MTSKKELKELILNLIEEVRELKIEVAQLKKESPGISTGYINIPDQLGGARTVPYRAPDSITTSPGNAPITSGDSIFTKRETVTVTPLVGRSSSSWPPAGVEIKSK